MSSAALSATARLTEIHICRRATITAHDVGHALRDLTIDALSMSPQA
jgi:hypothetical protein